MDVEVDINGEVEVEEFKNLFLTCLPTKREMKRVSSKTGGRASLGVAMQGINYQLDYIRTVNNNKHSPGWAPG